MSYIGYDQASTNPDTAPEDGAIYVGYGNGDYQSYWNLHRKYGDKAVASTVQFVSGYMMCDCENGDLTPEQAVALAKDANEQGRPFISYGSEATKGQIERVAIENGLEFPTDPAGWEQGVVGHYWWAASPVFPPQEHLVPGALGTQWGWYKDTYDVSTWLADITHFGSKPTNKDTNTMSLPAVPNVPVDSEPIESSSGKEINAPIVGAVAVTSVSNPGEHGYYVAGADGGVYTFGSAVFHGSIPELIAEGKLKSLNEPIVGIIAFDNGGYGLVAADGGLFVFGDFPFDGTVV